MAGAAARGGLKCLQCCGYFCQVVACGVETLQTIWGTFTKICTCGQGWGGLFWNTLTLCFSEEDPDNKDYDLPVVEERRLTDAPALLGLIATLIGMCYAMNRSLEYGRPEVFEKGVDSYTNVCGSNLNARYASIPDSGRNMQNYSRVILSEFFIDPGKISLEKEFQEYTFLCVKACPTVQDMFSCVEYLRESSPYGPTLVNSLCRQAMIQMVPEFVVLNGRCVPKGSLERASINLQNSLLHLYSNNWLSNVIHDSSATSAELTWLVLIAVGCSLVFLVIVHGAAAALCWYSYTTFSLVGIASTIYMWYLYIRIISPNSGISLFSDEGVGDFSEANGGSTQQEYANTFRNIAIISTVIVFFLTVANIATGSRNMNAAAVVFEAGTGFAVGVKWIYLLPLTTLASMGLVFGLWLYTVSHQTAIFTDTPDAFQDADTGLVKGMLVLDSFYINLVLLFEFVAIIWIFNFFIGCQHLLVGLTIGTYYFTINKSEMYRPMRVALSRLIRKHLGSAFSGAFFTGFFAVFKAPFSFVQSRVITSTEKAIKKLEEASDEPLEGPTESQGPIRSKRGKIIFPSGRDQNYGGRRRRSSVIKETRNYGVRTEQFLETKENENEEVEDEFEDAVEKKKGPDPEKAVESWLFVNKLCSPCFWLHNSILIFISDLNYSVVAVEGLWFLEGGRWVRDRLNEEQRLKTVLPIASYALFLAKLTVTMLTLPVGFLLLKDKEGVFLYGYPIAVAAIMCFTIAHAFFSLFEASTAAAFVCYMEDKLYNDGNEENPYFGPSQFFEDFEIAMDEQDLEIAPSYTNIHVEDEEDVGVQRPQRRIRKGKAKSLPIIHTDDGTPQGRRKDSKEARIREPPESDQFYYEDETAVSDDDDEDDDFSDDTVVQQPKRLSRRGSTRPEPEPQSLPKEPPPDDSDQKWTGVFPFNPLKVFEKMPEDNTRVSVVDDYRDEEDDRDVDGIFDAMGNIDEYNDRSRRTSQAGRRQSKQQKDKTNQRRQSKQQASKQQKNQPSQKKSEKMPDAKKKPPPRPPKPTPKNVPSKPTAKNAPSKPDSKNAPPKPMPRKAPPKPRPRSALPKPTPKSALPRPKDAKSAPSRPPPPKLAPKKNIATQPKRKAPPPPRPPKPKSLPTKNVRSTPKLKSKIPKPVKPAAWGRGRALPTGKMGRGKGLKAPTKIGKGFKAPKGIGRGFKAPKGIGKGFGSMRVPRGRAGRLGAADPMEGVAGAINIADGLLRITGKKEEAGEAARQTAYGTRNRAKATGVLSNTIDWIQKEQEPTTAWYYPEVIRNWKLRKDLITGTKQMFEDTDKEWDEHEAQQEEEEENEESYEEPAPRKVKRRRRINRV